MMAIDEYSPEVAAAHWWWQARADTLRRILDRRQVRDAEILDVGCGTGVYLPVLAEFGHVTGVDNCQLALEACPVGYDVKLASCYELPFEHADVLATLDMLEHLDNDQAALWEMHRVMAKNGLIVVSVPANPGLWSDHDVRLGHFRRYTKPALEALMTSTGFTEVKVWHSMGSIFPGAWLHRRISRHPSNGTPEGFKLPGWANSMLYRICEAENAVPFDLPVGTSLFATGRKL